MLNKAILIGRLTSDPELRHTPSNTAVTSFTLAVNRTYGSGEQTDFIDIVAWSSTAEFVSKWFKKGMQVAVSGRIQTRTWEDKAGGKRKSTEIVADEVFFADSKRDPQSQPQSQPRKDYNGGSQLPNADFPANDSGFGEFSEDSGELPF